MPGYEIKIAGSAFNGEEFYVSSSEGFARNLRFIIARPENIAAASILAKTYRDDYMIKIGSDFPEYKWNNNKGYPTQYHRSAIEEFGVTEHHRKSFQLLPNQIKIDFE